MPPGRHAARIRARLPVQSVVFPDFRGAVGLWREVVFPRVCEWVRAGVSLVYPEVCDLCGREPAGPAEGFVGQACRSMPGHLKRIDPPYCDRCGLPHAGEILGEYVCGNCSGVELGFRRARAALESTPFLLEVIHRYKYGKAVWLEGFLAAHLVEAAAEEVLAEGCDGIVPVPLHPGREREREFNQAERLAVHLARATGLPLENRLLRRRAATRSQALLDRRERSKNVAGAFEVRGDRSLDGRRLVVVDDVLTTGATTSAVGAVLRRAGAADVVVWTVARGR